MPTDIFTSDPAAAKRLADAATDPNETPDATLSRLVVFLVATLTMT